MDMTIILPVFAFGLFGISVAGFIYALMKKKPKGLWVGLFIVSIILPFALLIAFGEKKETVEDKYGEAPFVEPVIDELGNIKLKEGHYIIGENIPAGSYDAQVETKFGDIMLFGIEPTKVLIQRLGLEGIEKVRLSLEDKDELRVADDTTLNVVKEELLLYEELTLYPGIWYIGKDITPGRYTILPTTDTTGEVHIYEETTQKQVANGHLGLGQEPPAISIDLNEGYRLEISNMNFNLVPVGE